MLKRIESFTGGELLELNNDLNSVIDSMTDENCKPLECFNAEMVKSLQAIAFKLYKKGDELDEQEFLDEIE